MAKSLILGGPNSNPKPDIWDSDTMAIGVVEFSREGYKFRKDFA